MARPLRLEFENALYHITSRGNERKDIFIDDADYAKFFSYLEHVVLRYKPIVYCYCVMKNHYHLLIETPQPNLSRLMRDLNGAYTIYFNRRRKRSGHLFQGRYKAILVDRESYLLELSRYIHLNPVRAKIAKSPEEHKYSSVNYYFSDKQAPFWLNTEFILSQFGNNKKDAREEYKKFVYRGISNIKDPLRDTYANTILGSSEFINKIKDDFLSKRDIPEDISRSKALRSGKNLSEIAELVLKHYNTDLDALRKKGGKDNQVKKLFVYLSRKYTDSGLEQIRNFLNSSVTAAAISKMFSRTETELRKQEGLRQEVRNLGNMLYRTEAQEPEAQE